MQKEVAKKLDNECEANDEIIKSLNEKVRLLHELRDSVISDAVLGKIDIRGIAIPDYEYVDEEADSETDEDSEETEEQED
jgi:restriction endonuclease S subunits-like protein